MNLNEPAVVNPQGAPHVTIFSCLFAVFGFAVLLPLMYGFAQPMFEEFEVKLPGVTELFFWLTPWMSIGLGLIICLVLVMVQFTASARISLVLGWLSILFTALITLAGTLGLAMPLLGVVKGLSN